MGEKKDGPPPSSTQWSRLNKGVYLPKIIPIAVSVTVVVCLIVWRGAVARERFQNNITKISAGMAKTEVILILGQPEEFKKPCYSPRPVCDQDLVYPAPFNLVGFWTVSFDTSGHVIDKFYWQSP